LTIFQSPIFHFLIPTIIHIYASFHFQSHRGYIIIIIIIIWYKGYIIIYSLIISQMFLIWCHNFLIQYPTTHAMCVSAPLNYNSCVFHWTSLSFLPKTWLSDCFFWTNGFLIVFFEQMAFWLLCFYVLSLLLDEDSGYG
jgi:hypothetical protein